MQYNLPLSIFYLNCISSNRFHITFYNIIHAFVCGEIKGEKIDTGDKAIPSFGAAADGDGDRNMILGSAHRF